MPRGIPKAGFRNRKKKAKASVKPAYVPTGRKRGRPSKAEMMARVQVQVAEKAKEVVNVPVVGSPVQEMDVAAFLIASSEAIAALKKAAGMTNHVAESEMMMNFARVIERQVQPKYKKPLIDI